MKTPKSPDYEQIAREQGAANLETARFNASANRPDVYSPYGSQEWVKHPTDPDRWVLRETLSPAEQQKLEQTNRIELESMGAMNAQLPNMLHAALGQPWGGMDSGRFTEYLLGDPEKGAQYDIRGMEGVPGVQYEIDEGGVPGRASTDMAMRQRMEDAAYGRQTSRLDPRFQQQQADMETKLRNQGITPGSKAWTQAMDEFNRAKNDAYSSASQDAIGIGAQELDQQFNREFQNRGQGWGEALDRLSARNSGRGQAYQEGMGRSQLWNQALGQEYNIANMRTQAHNQGRAQNLNEYMQHRMLPLNVMASMLGMSQVNMPQFQPFNNNITADPAPLFQAGLAQGQANLNRANAQNGMINNLISGGMSMFRPSDRRLKSNIRRIGSVNGVNLYAYRIMGKDEWGVMADEVPWARKWNPAGYWMVDYSKVM